MPQSRFRRRHHRWKRALLAGLGGGLIIAALGLLDSGTRPWLLGSLGSSAVLVFGFPDSGFSKPGRVVGGHVLCAAIGLATLHLLGHGPISLGLSVMICITLMLGLRLMHPPAGSNPLIVHAVGAGWSYLLFPVLVGSLALVLFATAWNRRQPKESS